MRKNISAIMAAILVIGLLSFLPVLTNADPSPPEGEVQQVWVRMRGIIDLWGSTPVFGWIGAHARIVNTTETYREWARAHAIWSEEPHRLNCTEPPTENFTFTLYATRLINSSIIELDYNGYDFYVEGQWDVVKITTTVYIDEEGELINITRTLEPIVTNATGELRVFSNWTQFEISITGLDLLSGRVTMHVIGYMEIKICDMNGDGRVRIEDLVRVAKRYGSRPGLGNYDFEMDFDNDCEIGIGDLTTLAANMEG